MPVLQTVYLDTSSHCDWEPPGSRCSCKACTQDSVNYHHYCSCGPCNIWWTCKLERERERERELSQPKFLLFNRFQIWLTFTGWQGSPFSIGLTASDVVSLHIVTLVTINLRTHWGRMINSRQESKENWGNLVDGITIPGGTHCSLCWAGLWFLLGTHHLRVVGRGPCSRWW